MIRSAFAPNQPFQMVSEISDQVLSQSGKNYDLGSSILEASGGDRRACEKKIQCRRREGPGEDQSSSQGLGPHDACIWSVFFPQDYRYPRGYPDAGQMTGEDFSGRVTPLRMVGDDLCA